MPHNLVPEKLMKIIKRKYLDFKKNIILRQFIKKYYARNGAIYIFNNFKKKIFLEIKLFHILWIKNHHLILMILRI